MKRGYVRGSPRMKAKRQLEAMAHHGITTIYEEGGDEVVWDFVRSIREGDEACVYSMDRLAPRRSMLKEIVSGIHERGGVIVELSTGMRSDDRDHLADMIFNAASALARDGTAQQSKIARRNGLRGGRPPKTDRLGLDKAKAIWFDPKHVTTEDVITHMPGWTLRTAYRAFGPRRVLVGRRRKP